HVLTCPRRDGHARRRRFWLSRGGRGGWGGGGRCLGRARREGDVRVAAVVEHRGHLHRRRRPFLRANLSPDEPRSGGQEARSRPARDSVPRARDSRGCGLHPVVHQRLPRGRHRVRRQALLRANPHGPLPGGVVAHLLCRGGGPVQRPQAAAPPHRAEAWHPARRPQVRHRDVARGVADGTTPHPLPPPVGAVRARGVPRHPSSVHQVQPATQELPVRVLPDQVRAVGGVGAGRGQGGRVGSPHPLRRRRAVCQGHTREGRVER
ncbi:unnamed protein product, partial [Ectocarpus sp. 13 AM-2016]